ncbi:hypothetical protein BJ875DRAFT_374536 [Amylocarpus encephaloides]|uniref:LPXTG-domain-containing protein n=1 Tax=Amylocarpus encephaloides TaxID=45428 RepID=A0A9P7YLH8_9HELO|nr:hypothetical protein BJ875DRAFT_374536 [Amylocarpus encephaloides]
MRFSLFSSTFALLSIFTTSVTAIQALTSSPCASECGNVLGSTTGADIECLDAKFTISPGSIFKSCVSCQLRSQFIDPATKQTDLQMGLYNLRYAVSWCLFGYPNNTNVGSTPCTIGFSCGPLEKAFEYDSLSPQTTTLGYCSQNYHSTTIQACKNCLGAQTEKKFLNNYAIALQAACEQQTLPGQTISIEGSIFSDIRVNITDPTKDPNNVETSTPTGGLTLGAKIGIAVGALLVILAITGFCIIWNGRRRRRRILAQRQRESGYDDWRKHHNFEQTEVSGGNPMTSTPQDGSSSAGGFFDSPASTRPLVSQRPWPQPQPRDEESPLSAVGEKAYFSPYSSNYSSPISAIDQVQTIGTWPQDRKGSLGMNSALGRQKGPEKVEREPDGDRIEMQNVAPVLLHPGNGRGQPAGLAAEDARRGHF